MSYIKIWIHAVWGTKDRVTVLQPEILKTVCNHIQENAKTKEIHIDSINGYDEHVHVLMLLKSDNSISKQMQLIKGESAFWINKNKIIAGKFEWAVKYFAASVSDNKVNIVRTYIKNQQSHHKKQTFAEEYNNFLKSFGYKEDFD